jgi:hypothetical protein
VLRIPLQLVQKVAETKATKRGEGGRGIIHSFIHSFLSLDVLWRRICISGVGVYVDRGGGRLEEEREGKGREGKGREELRDSVSVSAPPGRIAKVAAVRCFEMDGGLGMMMMMMTTRVGVCFSVFGFVWFGVLCVDREW